MRDYLFRGKRESDGKWLYGIYSDDYVHDTDFPCIFPLRSEHDDGDWSVIRETVGQYTGLTDKSDNRIFEGDILEFTYDYGEKSLHIVQWSADYSGWATRSIDMQCDPATMDFWDDYRECYAVIGSIHDNPELMKEKN